MTKADKFERTASMLTHRDELRGNGLIVTDYGSLPSLDHSGVTQACGACGPDNDKTSGNA